MERMERTVQGIGRAMGSLPIVLAETDRMRASVGFISGDVDAMAGGVEATALSGAGHSA